MLEPKATARKQHVEAQDETGRTDPRPRRFEGGFDGVKIKNRDPLKHYVLVYGPQVDEYAENGYALENFRKGGPSVGIGLTAKEGEPIGYRGHFLMSIDKTSKRDQDINGSLDGHGFGWRHADMLEEQILDKNGAADPLRGIGNYVRVDRNDPNHQISAVTPEFGI